MAGSSFPVCRSRGNDEHGVALVLTLMSIVLLLTLGGALIVVTSTETTIAARFRDGLEAFYAADAGIARAVVDLRTADWDAARAGTSRSSFADNGFDLAAARRDLDGVAEERDWHPFAYGQFSDLVPGAAADGRLSVVLWVAAEPSSADNQDENQIVVRSHAYGPKGIRRMVEATVRQTVDGPRVTTWREDRDGC
jgi:hypothetical protein